MSFAEFSPSPLASSSPASLVLTMSDYSQFIMWIIITAALLLCCSYSLSTTSTSTTPGLYWLVRCSGKISLLTKFLLMQWVVDYLRSQNQIISFSLSVIGDLASSSAIVSWRLKCEMLLAAFSSPFLSR